MEGSMRHSDIALVFVDLPTRMLQLMIRILLLLSNKIKCVAWMFGVNMCPEFVCFMTAWCL
jgi:hypothetical protein